MMNSREILHILITILVLAVVISFTSIILGEWEKIGIALLFAAIIIVVNVTAKKAAAAALDSDVEHRIWMWSRYGFKPGWNIGKPIPLGVILPLVMTAFSLGVLKCMTFLTYETAALKRRAARRFGFYSFSEMTDWHNALIGAAGIASVLAVSFIFYWIPGFEGLPRLAAYYAFWNMIPFSKLDGTHILFGSKVLYTALASLTIVFALAAFVIR
jgi:hypothetical protein